MQKVNFLIFIKMLLVALGISLPTTSDELAKGSPTLSPNTKLCDCSGAIKSDVNLEVKTNGDICELKHFNTTMWLYFLDT